MDYRIMIFMARERLAAIDIGMDGKTDVISIDGNEEMEYSSEGEIKEFCQYIKDYYNIDAFSDLGMSVFILRFDAVMEQVSILLDEVRGAAEYNILSAEKLLPWLALKEGALKAGTAIQVQAFDIVYMVSLDNGLVMHCQIGGTREHSFMLRKEKFCEWGHLSECIVFGDEEEKNELSKNYGREIEKLKKQLAEEKKKTKAVEDKLAEVTSEISEIRDERKRNSRTICRVHCRNKEKERMFLGKNAPENSINVDYLLEHWNVKEYSFCIKNYCDDVEIVKEGQKIAYAEVWHKDFKENSSGSYAAILGLAAIYASEYNDKNLKKKGTMKRDSTEDFTITATASGRLFWLQESGTELSYGADIAVIGEVSDTREEVINWYAEEVKKRYEKN